MLVVKQRTMCLNRFHLSKHIPWFSKYHFSEEKFQLFLA